MSARALIVEDNLSMVESLTDILAVMRHESESADTMTAARECLARSRYDYLILDMAIPVTADRLPDREVGRRLLEEIRACPETERLPVLVMTGEDRGESDFIHAVLRTGGYDRPLVAYMQKSTFSYDRVSQTIQSLLSDQPGVAPPAPPQKPTTAFAAQTRRVTIYRHRVDVCGVSIWSETESGDLRKALIGLNRKDAEGRYRGFSGAELVPERNASNKIGPLIKRFRDNATERLRADRDLECGPDDIVANQRRRGYYLRDWIEIEEVDADGPDESTYTASAVSQPGTALPEAATAPTPGEVPAFEPTKRQRAILKAMSASRIGQKELIAKLRCSKATVNRELAVLREAGLYITGVDNIYALTEVGRSILPDVED